MINVLVDTRLYEPCHHDDSNVALYLHHQPQTLYPYIKSFANNNNIIIISPPSIESSNDMTLCIGPGL